MSNSDLFGGDSPPRRGNQPNPNQQNDGLFGSGNQGDQGGAGRGGQNQQQGDGQVINHENVPDSVANNWHPDYSLSSDSAKAWFQQSQQQKGKSLNLDQNGDYVVQFGDDLSTIAARELTDTGKAVNTKSVRDETAQLISMNDQNFPSLDKNADLIKTGWKLHIENPNVPQPVTDDQRNGGSDNHRCFPKRQQGGEVTPNGYDNKPSIYVNNFYGNNNTVYEGGGAPQVMPRNHQAYGGNPGDGSGSTGLNGGPRGRGGNQGNGGDLYNYNGPNGPSGQGGNGGDLYNYNGPNGPNAQGRGGSGGDLYNYNGPNSGQGNNSGDLYNFNGPNGQQQQQRPRDNGPGYYQDGNGAYHVVPVQPRPYSNGWGNNGTTLYPGFNNHDGGGQQRPMNVYINNFYGNNNTVYEGGGSNGNPQTRIQGGACHQNGGDNYYNNGGGRQMRNGGSQIQQIPNYNGDAQAQQIPNYTGDAQAQPIPNYTGGAQTQYLTYNGQGGSNDGSYQSDRSQQGYNVNPNPANYNQNQDDSVV